MQLNIFYMQVCRRTPHTGTYYYAITKFAVNHVQLIYAAGWKDIKMQVSRGQINACLHFLRRKTIVAKPSSQRISIYRAYSVAVRYRSGTKKSNDSVPEERTVPDRRRRCYKTVPDRREQTSNQGHMRESATADEPTFDSWSLEDIGF
ncbi:hypothetical protein PRUPE_5G037800 [Prunus persica]|uniref:Uncharacterized protein n=1 Tax=Prunus persica TaxID=3760 RepID=A0A251P3E0_PRUPE|nr:hypothetical protein PRUPE_5G037800 [Prunus persica]